MNCMQANTLLVCIQLIVTMGAKNVLYIYLILTVVFDIVYEVNSILPPSTTIQASEAPFMVYIRNERHYCGGVILKENIVLTATHCISDMYMMVTAGRSEKYSNKNAQSIYVKKTLPHEDYQLDPNGIQAYYDVGLLLLRTPFTFNEHVQPIEWTNNVDETIPATLYGWGSTDAFENAPSLYLRSKNISLISHNDCIKLLSKAVTKCTKQEYEICAEKSACNGDSGGPIVQTSGNVTKLIGITSWLADDNINCDTAPAVFERVGYFSTWIKDGIKSLLQENATENPDDKDNIVFPK